MTIELKTYDNAHRALDMVVAMERDDVDISRELFVHAPDQASLVLALTLQAASYAAVAAEALGMSVEEFFEHEREHLIRHDRD